METDTHKPNIITVDFSHTSAHTLSPTEDDGVDTVMKDWRQVGPGMRIDQAMAYLLLSLSSELGGEEAAEREIKERCRWTSEWTQWKKKKKQELGTDEVSFLFCYDPYRVEVKALYPQWGVMSGPEAIHGADEEPQWAWKGILAKKGSLLTSGLPHSTKSLNMLEAALESVTTRLVWGKFRVPESVRNVVFVETEDSTAMVKRRLKAFCKGLGIPHPPRGFHLVRPGPFSLIEEGEERLREIIKKTRADILILSTLQGLINGVDWKEQKDMAPVNAIFVRLQQLCSLVVITHSPWSEKRAAGSVTQAANFSSLMHFEKRTRDDGRTITSVSLDSKESGEEQKFDLELETVRTGESSTQVRRVSYLEKEKGGRPPSGDSEKIQRAIALRRDAHSIREIAEELKESKSTVSRWVKEVK